MGFTGLTFEVGSCVLTEYNDDGFLMAQPDGLGADARLASYELHHQAGFESRPADPEVDADGNVIQGRGCNLLLGTVGNERHAVLLADPRFVLSRPPLGKGDAVQYALRTAPSFDHHSGEDGTKTIYVEVGDSAHLIIVGHDGNGDPIVEIVHADGMAITMLKNSLVIKNNAGDCYIELNDSGGTLNGNWKVVGAFDIGETSFTLAKAAELITWATNVNTALNGLGAPIAPLSPSVATTLTKGT